MNSPVDRSSDHTGRDDLAEALALAHRVAVLAETDPGAPLIVATRAALEVADARRADRRRRRAAGWDVHGGDGAWWARWADQWMPYTELAALRATAPDPDIQTCPVDTSTSTDSGSRGARTRNEPDGARGDAPKQTGVPATVPTKDGE